MLQIMKTKNRILLMPLLMITMLMLSSPVLCRTGKSEPVKPMNVSACAMSTINVVVTVPSDCDAAQYCDWIICIYDVTSCVEDVQPVDCQDYQYGKTSYYFTVDITNSHVRACMMHKPGSAHCDNYTHYAPDCDCKPTDTNMSFTLDICVP